MPTALLFDGYRFFFYSNESSEPIHVHVEKGEGVGKIWLEPEVKIAYLKDFNPREERQIKEIVSNNIGVLKAKWNEYFL